MAYQKTEWVENETLVSAVNLNKIEDQLESITDSIEIHESTIKSTEGQVGTLSTTVEQTVETITSHIVENATTTSAGHVQLLSAVDSESETLAATPKAVKTAYDRADAAIVSATAAQGRADSAYSLAETASGKADTAQGKADQAYTLAETANGKADTAQDTATAAQSKADSAYALADTAVTNASTAQGTATAAQGRADEAHTLANTAIGNASTAQGRADQAYDRAEQAFTQANDIKTKWASVVGNPLTPSDTQAELESKTQTIKNTLATNLTKKGQASSGTEALQELVNKIPNISTGKRFAMGTAYSTKTPGYVSNSTVVVSSLQFRPRYIILDWNFSAYGRATYSDDAYAINRPALTTTGQGDNAEAWFGNKSVNGWSITSNGFQYTNIVIGAGLADKNATYIAFE